MVNKAPNQAGLKQNRKTAKNRKRKQKKLDAQIKAITAAESKVKKIRADTNKFIDTYMIFLAEKYPNDVATAKALLKWKELKDKENIDEFLNMEF